MREKIHTVQFVRKAGFVSVTAVTLVSEASLVIGDIESVVSNRSVSLALPQIYTWHSKVLAQLKNAGTL